MENIKGNMSSSKVEERVRDFVKVLQELCRVSVALDNTETSFSGAPSNASTSTAAARDNQTRERKKEEEEEEEKMAVVYIVLVLLFFSASLIILLVRHVRRERETMRVERFYTDYLLNNHTAPSPVVYFDKEGGLLQERDLPTSTIQPQISDHAGTSTSSENPVLAYSSPSVSAGGGHLSSESSGTDLDVVNCAGDATKTSSNPTILNASVDATEPHAHHSNTNEQPRDTTLSTEPLREATQTECNAAILNTTLASTLPGTIKCMGFDNTTSEATDMYDNICQMSPNPLPVNTTTENNIKLSGKPTSV